jgi:thioredoxin-dependent peroxiredoxin
MTTFVTAIFFAASALAAIVLVARVLAEQAPHNAALPSAWTTPLQVGDLVPNVTFQTRVRIEEASPDNNNNPFDWKAVTTADLFAGKRVVLFALPGAFTPTCSTTHLPGYEAAYNEITATTTTDLGIDEVYCLSVNDAFVMRQWGLHLGLSEDRTIGSPFGFHKVKLIPDGAAAFTRGMGMVTIWSTERGFGERSWRYSMVVSNGVIEKMFVEEPKIQNSGPDPFEVSDAATMLAYLRSVAAIRRKDEL